jgi:hypothetical protein
MEPWQSPPRNNSFPWVIKTFHSLHKHNPYCSLLAPTNLFGSFKAFNIYIYWQYIFLFQSKICKILHHKLTNDHGFWFHSFHVDIPSFSFTSTFYKLLLVELLVLFTIFNSFPPFIFLFIFLLWFFGPWKLDQCIVAFDFIYNDQNWKLHCFSIEARFIIHEIFTSIW